VGFGYDTAWTERRRAYVADGASGS
jgi:hypothetical protein